MKVSHNIRYDTSNTCLLDVYGRSERGIKRRDNVAPVVIIIHGGGWVAGSKSNVIDMASHFSSHGYVAVAPCYRLSTFSNTDLEHVIYLQLSLLTAVYLILGFGRGKTLLYIILMFLTLLILAFAILRPRPIVQHPVHVKDVAAVVAWTYHHIKKYGGDADNIILLGHSAGGHLAALVSNNPQYLHALNISPTIIKATICISGVFSDKRLLESRFGVRILYSAFGKRSSYVDAFPIYHAQPTSPPHLLMNANLDYSLKRHTWDFFMALRQQGVYVRSKMYKNTNHISIRKNWSRGNEKVFRDILQFLDDVLKK